VVLVARITTTTHNPRRCVTAPVRHYPGGQDDESQSETVSPGNGTETAVVRPLACTRPKKSATGDRKTP
jgi:hypothetical protein